MDVFYLWLLSIFLYVPSLSEAFLFPKYLALILGSLVIFLARGLNLKPIRFSRREATACALLGAGTLVSTYRSAFAIQSFFEGLWWVAALGLCYVLTTELQGPNASRVRAKFGAGLFAVSVSQIIIGISQIIFFYFRRDEELRYAKTFFAGSYGNPEYLAFLFGLSFLSLSDKNRWKQLVLVIGILLSRSKATLCFIPLALWLSQPQMNPTERKKIKIFGLAAIAFAIAMTFIESERSFSGRLLLNAAAGLMAFKSKFLGCGYGCFEYRLFESFETIFSPRSPFLPWAPYAGWTFRVHNEFLDLLVEGGFMSLAGLMLWLFALAPKIPAASPALRARLYFILFASLFSFPWHVSPNLILCAWTLAELKSTHSDIDTRPFKVNAGFMLFFLSILLGISSMISFKLTLESIRLKDLTLSRATAVSMPPPASSPISSSPSTLEASFKPFDQAEALMRMHLKNHQFAQALRESDRALAFGNTIQHMRLRCFALRHLEQSDQALSCFARINRAYPQQITPWLERAELELKLGRLDAARWSLKQTQSIKALNTKARYDKFRSEQLLNAIPQTN